MLQHDFFRVITMQTDRGLIRADLELNPGHPIFKGHFPGQPVVPGVCMMQMVKEIVETDLGTETRLLKAEYLKFLSLINPMEGGQIRAELRMEPGPVGHWQVTGILTRESSICMKCSIRLAEIKPPT